MPCQFFFGFFSFFFIYEISKDDPGLKGQARVMRFRTA